MKNKTFNIMYNVGKAKYLVNYCNGVKTHSDGSSFYDVQIFKNKVKLNTFVSNLKQIGYNEF